MNIQREIIVSTLEEMCDLMCGGIEEDYDLREEYSDLLSGETLWLTNDELRCIIDNMNEIGINTLMIQKCKEGYACKVDEPTVRDYKNMVLADKIKKGGIENVKM